MKRYSLLIQLVIYVFIMILALLGIVGGIYYQTSSVAIRQTTEQNTRKTIQQSGQFITSYLQKLKEANLAFFFSIFYSKDDILKAYLENIYF